MLTVFFSTEEPALPPTVDEKIWYVSVNNRLSAVNLKTRENIFIPFPGKQMMLNTRFAYLWVKLKNTGDRAEELVLYNKTVNYYTECLIPGFMGAVTLYRHGDMVPISESPIPHRRAAFPLSIPADSTKDIIIEYHSPSGIVVEPGLTNSISFLSYVSRNRGTISFFYGVMSIFLLFLIVLGIYLKGYYYYWGSIFLTTVVFSSLVRTRVLLLLIDPLIYPLWLFPFSIMIMILGAVFFISFNVKPYVQRWYRWTLRIIGTVSIPLTMTSVFSFPFQITDILHLLAIGIICMSVIGVYRSVQAGHMNILWMFLSLLPWLSIMVTDILTGYLNIRMVFIEEYGEFLGLITSIILFSATFLHLHRRNIVSLQTEIARKNENKDTWSANHLLSLSKFRSSIAHEMNYRLTRPIDSIIAAAKLLGREHADPRLTAAGRVVIEEAAILKRLINRHSERLHETDVSSGSDEQQDSISAVSHMDEIVSFKERQPYGYIWIFDADHINASRTALILRSEGYRSTIGTNSYDLLQTSSSREIDALIIDFSSVGDQVFSLCGLIRSNHNLLELPILMITPYNAEYLLEKGYAAGVNDFLTHPFDASELVTRIQSLVKLKHVAAHNTELARSEKEKNIFLYFLTHNVNTPLTLLINRVRELEELISLDDLHEIVEDLRDSSREISDIVQNVLISFRIADGRHTLMLEETELPPILETIERDIRKKAEAKKQQLDISTPSKIPTIRADYTAVRGVLYNLVDNAVKFSPTGGAIRIIVYNQDPLRIAVHDSGPGIPPEERHRLFTRFESLSTRPTGGESSTGLGLYVAHELIKMNGGSLHYTDGSTGGCFVIHLPLYIEQEREHA